MKSLIFFLMVFILPAKVQADALENIYDKSITYKYFIEPFLGLDEFVQETYSDVFKVTHCQIIDDIQNEEVQKQLKQKNSSLSSITGKIYGGLGSCLYETLDLYPKQEGSGNNPLNINKKQILVYMVIHQEEVRLLLTFNLFSTTDILGSYWNRQPERLISNIQIKTVSPHSALDIVNTLLSLPIEKNPLAGLNISPVKEADNINEIQLNVQPHKNDHKEQSLLSVTLSLLANKKTVYQISAFTNYYAGSSDFFIVSKDQYTKND